MNLDDWVKIAPLISCSAIAVSAFVAFSVFVYTRRANRRRATLDMVMRSFLDKDASQLYDNFKSLVRRDEDEADAFKLTALVNYDKQIEAERTTVIDQLNTYELVSLGIRRGVFDEKFYKLWFHRQFTTDYESVKPLIDALQKDKPSLYYEFRTLNERWMRNKHPVASPGRLRMAWWALTKKYDHLDAARRSATTK